METRYAVRVDFHPNKIKKENNKNSAVFDVPL